MALTMYDSIDLNVIPSTAQAVAGYVGGRWPTFHLLAARWPQSYRLSIAVSANEDAQALDVETGDARPEQAVAWVQRQHRRGVARPTLYASISQWPALLEQLRAGGLHRASFRVWTAHYTGHAHRCDQHCNADFRDEAGATQYTDRALGRNLDASLVMGQGWFRHDR